MKKITFLLFSFFTCICNLEAEVSLRHLINYDKSKCLMRLNQASTEELWDTFLEGQTELFFEPEKKWISDQEFWKDATSILEVGSGNGSYLSKLKNEFDDKKFYGIEKLTKSVQQANESYARDGIEFQEGDAENLYEHLSDFSDVVLFRLTLQHLQKPLLGLLNAHHYLHSNGYILIIDSCDLAKQTSHPIPSIDKALEIVADMQLNRKTGNRKITLDILQMLEDRDSHISKLYELISSNLDSLGRVLHENMRLEGELSRKQYFNHNLLFSTLLQRTYHVDVDMDKVYDELKGYLEDENAWTILGMHYLTLKKK